MEPAESEANFSGSRKGGQNLNNMVAKVTIETPGGTSSKYYLLYRDPCFSLGSLVVGALGKRLKYMIIYGFSLAPRDFLKTLIFYTGGLGVGFHSKVFFEQTRQKINFPFKVRLPEISLAMKLNNRPVNIPLLFGKTVWWRFGSRALLSSLLYCCLECRLQGVNICYSIIIILYK